MDRHVQKLRPMPLVEARLGIVVFALVVASPTATYADGPRDSSMLQRVQVRAENAKDEVSVSVRRGEDGFVYVCRSPCAFEVEAGSEMRVMAGDAASPARTFMVDRSLGPDVDVVVQRPDRGAFVGAPLLFLGGGVGLVGGIGIAGDAHGWFSGVQVAVGVALAVLGGGLIVAGGVWLSKYSPEPRVGQSPSRLRAPADGATHDAHDSILRASIGQASSQATGARIQIAF